MAVHLLTLAQQQMYLYPLGELVMKHTLRGPWLGLCTVLQSFHQASTACLGENLPREEPSS